MKKPDENIIRRLAYIKYFYKLAVEQSQKPEPLSSASILQFHDSIELFLQLAAEYLDVGKNKIEFMQYWDILDSTLGAGKITQSESIRRLNKARVAFKHHGTLPSKLDIKAFRASATNFFLENTPIIFNLEFSEISLVELVESNEAKESLILARKELNENNIENALKNAGIAFHLIMDEYHIREQKKFRYQSYYLDHRLNFLDISSFPRRLAGRDMEVSPIENKIIETLKELGRFLGPLQDAVRYLALGFDLNRYRHFERLIPTIVRTFDGTFHCYGPNWSKDNVPDVEEVRFCIDFVIETAIQLQEIGID
jgi:hypothetical protein